LKRRNTGFYLNGSKYEVQISHRDFRSLQEANDFAMTGLVIELHQVDSEE
jgi:hypothetical protein